MQALLCTIEPRYIQMFMYCYHNISVYLITFDDNIIKIEQISHTD